MDTILSIIVLAVIVVIVWAVAKFVLKLTGRIIGCVLTALIALGLLFIVFVFIL